MSRFMKHKVLLLIVVCVCLIGVGIFAYLYEPKKFFDIKLSFLITLFIGSYITILINNAFSSDNRKRDFLNDLLNKLTIDITSEKMYRFNNDVTRADILYEIRHLRNSVKILKKAGDKYIPLDIIEHISKKIEDYEIIIDNNIDNKNELRKKESEIKSCLSVIEDKLNEIRFQLYNF